MSALLLWMAMGWAGVELESPPGVGLETVVVVQDRDGQPVVGATVRAVHRPGLDGQRELAIGITDGRGRVSWVPARGGVTEVRAGGDRVVLGVDWGGVPAGTASLLGLAVLASGFGLGYGLVPPRPGRRRRRASRPRNRHPLDGPPTDHPPPR